MTRPVLDNRAARRLFLDRHGLGEPASGPSRGADLLAVIERLGFVQVDSVNTVERAHHMILHARRPSYRPAHLTPLLERDRSLFEHWTHDASIIPTAFFPHWKLRFDRDRTRLMERWQAWHGEGFDAEFDSVLDHVRANGPCGTADVGAEEERKSGGWWEWNPSKTALEFLWRTGQLSICHRDSFRKVYDLTERVLPDAARDPAPHALETVEWAANAALDRLGFATSGEIAAFWAKITPDEAKTWCQDALNRGEIIEIEIDGKDGNRRRCFARPDVVDAARDAPEPPGLIRILSPFDPALRDRKRAERLFGFHYRIEIFVPAPKRKYGYYVFPVMEGDGLIGRIDMKAERDSDRLHVTAFWPEAGVKMGQSRLRRLDSALDRSSRLAGVSQVSFADGWLRDHLQ